MERWTTRHVDNIIEWWRSSEPRSLLSFVWLGQAGFLIRIDDTRIVVDPYLSDSLAIKYRGKKFPHTRMMPAPVRPEEIDGADIVLSTHEHTDHMDPGTLPPLLAASPGAPVVLPRYSVALARERGVDEDRQVPLTVDEAYEHPSGVTITAVPAAHEDDASDERGNAKFLGYLISKGETTVYHSGDTVPYGELETRLSRFNINLALLPANGRDAIRKDNGIPGNFLVEEALDYHQTFCFGTTVLHHFGLFEFNTADPSDLRRAAASRGISESVIIPQADMIYEREI